MATDPHERLALPDGSIATRTAAGAPWKGRKNTQAADFAKRQNTLAGWGKRTVDACHRYGGRDD